MEPHNDDFDSNPEHIEYYQSNGVSDDAQCAPHDAYSHERDEYNATNSQYTPTNEAQYEAQNEGGFEPIEDDMHMGAPPRSTTSMHTAVKFQRVTPQHVPANDFNYSSVFDDLF